MGREFGPLKQHPPFSLLALSVVGTGILTERSWRTWDRLRATPARAGGIRTPYRAPPDVTGSRQQDQDWRD